MYCTYEFFLSRKIFSSQSIFKTNSLLRWKENIFYVTRYHIPNGMFAKKSHRWGKRRTEQTVKWSKNKPRIEIGSNLTKWVWFAWRMSNKKQRNVWNPLKFISNMPDFIVRNQMWQPYVSYRVWFFLLTATEKQIEKIST